jgi:hypothetical protein
MTTSLALVIYDPTTGNVLRTMIADSDTKYRGHIANDLAPGEAYCFMQRYDPTQTPERAVLLATGLNPKGI